MSRHARIRKMHALVRKMHAWGGYILMCMLLVSVFPRHSGALLYQRACRGHLAEMPNTNHHPSTRYQMALRGGQGSNYSVQGGNIWDISGMQHQTHFYYLNAQYTVFKVCLPNGFCSREKDRASLCLFGVVFNPANRICVQALVALFWLIFLLCVTHTCTFRHAHLQTCLYHLH